MTEPSTREPDDERLRQLLDIEQRLQDLVRDARDAAARRIADARAAGEEQLTAARAEAARADAERALAERADHEAALLAIRTASEAALMKIAGLPEERQNELARWAVAQAIAGTGEAV